MLLNTVSSNSTVSWVTRPIWLRRSRKRAVAHVDAIDQHSAFLGSKNRGTRLAKRAFAATVGPDDGDRLAELDPQIDVGQDRMIGPIAERNVFEDQLAIVTRNLTAPAGSSIAGLRSKS